MVKINKNNKFMIVSPTNADVKINKNYRNESIWHCIKKFNTNNDDVMDSEEIRAFNQAILKAAGSDKQFTPQELSVFAQELGCSVEQLKSAIIIINADVIAETLVDSLNPGLFSSQNPDIIEDLTNKINGDNVSEVWDQYQSLVDKNNSILKYLYKDSSLSKDILDNLEFSKAKTLLNHIVSSFESLANKYDVDIKSPKKAYNNAVIRQDKAGMDAAIREIGARLNMATREKNIITEKIATTIKNGYSVSRTQTTDREMKRVAAANGVDVTDDIYGNGTLGDTQSVALTKESRVILNAMNSLLQNEDIREMLQACIKHEDGCTVIYSQPKNQHYTVTEESLISAGVVYKSVIGDGDMSAFIGAVLKMAKLDNIQLKTTADAQEYIIKCFKPELFGSDRLNTK